MENFEPVILKEMIYNEEYMRKVYPYLKTEYFGESTEKAIFKTIHEYIEKYNARPSKEAIIISINSSGKMTEGEYGLVLEYFEGLDEIKSKQNLDWLISSTEEFCQNKAVRLAIQKAIKIYEGKNENVTVAAIPQLLMDAVAVSFDTNIGHDYIENVEERFDLYHQQIDKFPFDLDMFNKITNGGTPKKTLNIILAGCVHPNTPVKIRYRKREQT
jgi:replicative DNA helicase